VETPKGADSLVTTKKNPRTADAKPNTGFPRLETERLILRQITADDTEAIFRLFSDGKVVRYLDFPALKQRGEAKAIVAWCNMIWREGSGLRWGIVRKGEESIIGTCGFHNWVQRDFRADIGYDLAPRYWGAGLMRETLASVIEYGSDEMGLHRMQAMADPRNERSQQLLKRLGFTREGTLHEWRFYKGSFWTEMCYSLLQHNTDTPR
jgi:ribosomal-protein-alanine N-acetyltransferase